MSGASPISLQLPTRRVQQRASHLRVASRGNEGTASSSTSIAATPGTGMRAAEAAGLSANRASANRRAFFGSGRRSECFFFRARAAVEYIEFFDIFALCLVPITPRKGVLHVHVRYRPIAARISQSNNTCTRKSRHLRVAATGDRPIHPATRPTIVTRVDRAHPQPRECTCREWLPRDRRLCVWPLGPHEL